MSPASLQLQVTVCKHIRAHCVLLEQGAFPAGTACSVLKMHERASRQSIYCPTLARTSILLSTLSTFDVCAADCNGHPLQDRNGVETWRLMPNTTTSFAPGKPRHRAQAPSNSLTLPQPKDTSTKCSAIHNNFFITCLALSQVLSFTHMPGTHSA